MDQPSSPYARFAWVRKHDGRLVPFEADKISRDLFAAGEGLGKPDAFLARELTDSILHFLDAEVTGGIPTTSQISDLVIKVVRELGQPELAMAFAEAQAEAARNGDREGPPAAGTASASGPKMGPPLRELADWVAGVPAPGDLIWKTASSGLRDFSLSEIFTRDLVAAQSDGLLTISGLAAPLELSGWIFSTLRAAGGSVVEAIEESRRMAGEFLALDGPEYMLAGRGADQEEALAFAREVQLGLRLMRLRAVVNLNCAEPPPHLGELAMGPLFQNFQSAAEPAVLHKLAEVLLEEFLQPGPCRAGVRVDWHLGRNDFTADASTTLLRLARRALEGLPLAFAFDRPRRVVSLAEGLDWPHPAALLTVRLHLPRLIEQSGSDLDVPLFVKKLGSLARLALSAAKQKRDFLRRHIHNRPSLEEGFLLDRARLVVAPVGLEAAAQMLLGHGLCSGGSAPEFARQVVQRLHSVLQEDGRTCVLDTCVDSAPECEYETSLTENRGREIPVREACGLTAWDATAGAKSQLRAASVLHGVVGSGTAAVLLPEEALPSAEEIAELLTYAWKQTEVVRLRFVRMVRPQQQLAVPWEK